MGGSSGGGPFARAAEDDSALVRVGSSVRAPGRRVLAKRRRRRTLLRAAGVIALLVAVNVVIAITVRGSEGRPFARGPEQAPDAPDLGSLIAQGFRPRTQPPAARASAAAPEAVDPPILATNIDRRVARATAAVDEPSASEVADVESKPLARIMRTVAPVLTPPALPSPPTTVVVEAPPAADPPQADPPPAPESSVGTAVWIEAEQASVQAPIQVADLPGASDEQAIDVPGGIEPDEAAVELRFAVPQDGEYALWSRVADAYSESLTFTVDDAEPRSWEPSDADGEWTWYLLESPAELAAGEHSLQIAAEDSGALVDVVLVTDDLGFTPDLDLPSLTRVDRAARQPVQSTRLTCASMGAWTRRRCTRQWEASRRSGGWSRTSMGGSPPTRCCDRCIPKRSSRMPSGASAPS